MSKTKTKKRNLLFKVILSVIIAVIILSAVIIGMCLFNERPAVQTVATYQSSYQKTVINTSDDDGIEILPQNSEPNKPGIIFYVGAQIKPNAYIPLLARIAERGYPCFIPDLTCNMAALEPSAAEEIIKSHPEIKSWYIAGHSMGGLTASGFADEHQSNIDGLILIAAYTNRDMSKSDMPTLAVFGDDDGVMNKKLYDERKKWNTADFEEHIIPGANHAQYGDYGKQPRDNDAEITPEEQQSKTADIILDWLKRRFSEVKTNEQ